ncbi:hypothetical protein P3C24_26510 [Pseudomonas proteolytica]|uniref:hypothetical protein n=1 Tax=Pseudomonas proteolytica TaxID=219574 RepID=UPI0023DF520F|nr:hypothetical protein [Pseudomonas proteolytica]MDF3164491.1 hypothetical protein [Pseudomonas proteolytica]
MSILRKETKQELLALKEAATASYRNRQHGYDEFAGTDEKTGRAIGKMVTGAYVAELVLTPAEIIPRYLAKIAEGYTLHEHGTIPYAGATHYIYFYKPEAQQRADIKALHLEVEAKYREEIEEHNNSVVTRQVALEEANIDRQVEKELAAERQAQRDAIEARIRAELSK